MKRSWSPFKNPNYYENALDHLNKLIDHHLLPQLLHDLAVVWKCLNHWIEAASLERKVHFWCAFLISRFHTSVIFWKFSLNIFLCCCRINVHFLHLIKDKNCCANKIMQNHILVFWSVPFRVCFMSTSFSLIEPSHRLCTVWRLPPLCQSAANKITHEQYICASSECSAAWSSVHTSHIEVFHKVFAPAPYCMEALSALSVTSSVNKFTPTSHTNCVPQSISQNDNNNNHNNNNINNNNRIQSPAV